MKHCLNSLQNVGLVLCTSNRRYKITTYLFNLRDVFRDLSIKKNIYTNSNPALLGDTTGFF